MGCAACPKTALFLQSGIASKQRRLQILRRWHKKIAKEEIEVFKGPCTQTLFRLLHGTQRVFLGFGPFSIEVLEEHMPVLGRALFSGVHQWTEEAFRPTRRVRPSTSFEIKPSEGTVSIYCCWYIFLWAVRYRTATGTAQLQGFSASTACKDGQGQFCRGKG
eukprot:Gb_36609 [translate_table: standard]